MSPFAAGRETTSASGMPDVWAAEFAGCDVLLIDDVFEHKDASCWGGPQCLKPKPGGAFSEVRPAGRLARRNETQTFPLARFPER
jgi:hypothetical protein